MLKVDFKIVVPDKDHLYRRYDGTFKQDVTYFTFSSNAYRQLYVVQVLNKDLIILPKMVINVDEILAVANNTYRGKTVTNVFVNVSAVYVNSCYKKPKTEKEETTHIKSQNEFDSTSNVDSIDVNDLGDGYL